MGTMGDEGARGTFSGEDGVRVLFNAGKKETHTPSKGFKQLKRKLKVGYQIEEHKEKDPKDPLDPNVFNTKNCDIVIFAGSREKFHKKDFDILSRFIDDGGSLIILIGEGGERKYNTNLNYLLEQYGMFVNPDHVVRTVYLKPYSHPKEVCIQQGVLNRELTRAAKDLRNRGEASRNVDLGASLGGLGATTEQQGGLSVVYPYGATVNVQKPAVALMSTAQEAYPLNRPIMAVYDGKTATDANKKPLNKKGRLLVLGSTKIFEDEWLLKEDNSKLLEILIRWMDPREDMRLNRDDADDPDITEHHYVPDTGALALRMRCCLQEADEVPQDFTQLFDDTLFQLHSDKIPEVLKLYKEMEVKHEVLTLIPPQFEAPLPPLQPAVFPPAWREPPPPALDLFDLDEVRTLGLASRLRVRRRDLCERNRASICLFCLTGCAVPWRSTSRRSGCGWHSSPTSARTPTTSTSISGRRQKCWASRRSYQRARSQQSTASKS
jgi:intraflagellar transport protein 52